MVSVAAQKQRVALLSVLSNSLLVAGKLAIGFAIGSVSVISEAIHSAVDLVAAVIALFAVRSSARPADREHPYGHGKVENLSGTIEALLIFAAAGWILYEAVGKLRNPEAMDAPLLGVLVMAVSSVANWQVSRRLFKVGHATDSPALIADAWHLRTDVYTSLGVMAGLLVITVGGYLFPGYDLHWLDPLAAIAVAMLILKAAWELTQSAGRDLLDVALPEAEKRQVIEAIAAHRPTVQGCHRLRTRKAGSQRFVEFHLLFADTMSVAEAHAVSDAVTVAIRARLPNTTVLAHIEPVGQHRPLRPSEDCLAAVPHAGASDAATEPPAP